MRNRFRPLLLPLALLACLSVGRADDARPGPLVFAAASLTDVLQQVGADYGRATGAAVRFSFGSTATLARQIESGARADLFVAADAQWMDYVEQRALLRRASRRDLLGNRLVLVAPAASTLRLAIEPGLPLRAVLGRTGRLALADPASVPAGKYAKAALTALGAWREVEDRIVVADNVRMALMYVARGEAPLGVVYLTDAMAEPRVRVVGEFPATTHPPIVYPAALTTSAGAGAADFLAYLSGPAARRRFEAAGFLWVPAPAPRTPRPR
jgi:molybdate transport system substrate-binding protein